MLRSLYSGVSGLNNHQIRMDVIGNNVSNVNTHGFKRGRATFQDLLSQRISGAARPNEERGGINPRQVGLGVQIAAIDTIHTQGSLQTTGVNTDVAILGQGFFIHKDGDKEFFTRAGAFSLDRDGMLVNPATGFRVQGYQAVTGDDGITRVNTSGGTNDLFIEIGKKEPAKETGNIRYRSNLNKLAPIVPEGASEAQILEGTWSTTIKVFDSRGDNQDVQLNFVKRLDDAGLPIENEWVVTTRIFDTAGVEIEGVQAATEEGDVSNDFILRFNTAGAIESISNAATPDTPIGVDGERLSINLNYTVPGSAPQVIALDLGTAGRYDGITQFASDFSTKAYFQDGYGLGYLEGFSIDDIGGIVGSYTNGVRKELGQIALALFTNPSGLEKSGETYFTETNNSGEALFSPAGSQGVGRIRSGALEMSNVDLANEFTDMIVTQRGFQANSRSITTSDTMLEELLRLKR